MKFVVFVFLATLASAAPQYGDSRSRPLDDSLNQVPILRDDRILEDDGRYSVDVETGNGILLSLAGSPDAVGGAVIKTGEYSYIAPDGTSIAVRFVADENGYQPQSDLLPVAPEFPHPIPQYVLDQIAFANAEDAARARGEATGPSRT